MLSKIKWLDGLPEKFSGVVLANEVLDAIPVHMIHWKDEKIYQRGVEIAECRFVWEDKLLVEGDLYQKAFDLNPGLDYISEVSLAVPAFI